MPASPIRRGMAACLPIFALAAIAGPAQASLSLTGPVSPANNFPAWYQDADGTQLELCVADPGCPTSPPALDGNVNQDEAFWSIASATATGPGGQSVTLAYDVEAAYLDGPGTEISFGRVQVNMDGLEPNGVYTVTGPYGSDTWTAEADGSLNGGNASAQRHEAGCAPEFLLGETCNFDVALLTEIGPYLIAADPPAGYIGDGVTLDTATIGVGGVNAVLQVDGPGLPLGGISTDQWTVEGKLAGDPAPFYSDDGGIKGSFGNKAVDSTSHSTVTVRNNGLADMDLGEVVILGDDAASFKLDPDNCANQTIASGATCTIVLAFTPRTATDHTATLVVQENGAGGSDHTIALSGSGVAPPPVILPPVTVPPAIAAPAQSTTTTTTPTVPTTTAPDNDRVTLSSLSIRSKITRKGARRSGLRVRVGIRSDDTTGLRIRVIRVSRSGKRTFIGTFNYSPDDGGEFLVRLNTPKLRRALIRGNYQVEATPSKRGVAGTPTIRSFKVVK